ncbi:MAG: methyltransferase domain-containing protein [Haloarculaceae archaeon]
MAREGSETGRAWDADAYDGDHAFVYEYGEDLLGLLSPAADDRVLDLGCGTGHLTATVAETGASVVGVDRSREMLVEARAAHPGVRFVRGDARRLPFGGSFDAVLSNAVLHWVDDQDAALSSVHDALRPGGRFVAELGGTGNVSRIVRAVEAELDERGYEVGDPWHFPTVGEYADRLERHGFEVRSASLFDRPTELEDGAAGLGNWLRMFGEELLGAVPGPEREAVRSAAADRLREDLFEDGTWTADYRRLRFVAVRD